MYQYFLFFFFLSVKGLVVGGLSSLKIIPNNKKFVRETVPNGYFFFFSILSKAHTILSMTQSSSSPSRGNKLY